MDLGERAHAANPFIHLVHTWARIMPVKSSQERRITRAQAAGMRVIAGGNDREIRAPSVKKRSPARWRHRSVEVGAAQVVAARRARQLTASLSKHQATGRADTAEVVCRSLRAAFVSTLRQCGSGAGARHGFYPDTGSRDQGSGTLVAHHSVSQSTPFSRPSHRSLYRRHLSRYLRRLCRRAPIYWRT